MGLDIAEGSWLQELLSGCQVLDDSGLYEEERMK
jgi:hypothetical protein